MNARKRIKDIRKDMSEFVLHCTRDRICIEDETCISCNAFDVLKLILQDGFFGAGFAIGRSPLAQELKPKVRGPYPAVCFTEQPLRFYTQSIKANRRYTEFTVAVRKDELFNYGGRLVIYNLEEVLGTRLSPEEYENDYPPEAWVYKDGLPLELQYLWVHYKPTAIWEREYPIDFTHEREWRARPNANLNEHLGLSQQYVKIAVPLQLPTIDRTTMYVHIDSFPKRPRFAILVDSEERNTGKDTLTPYKKPLS